MVAFAGGYLTSELASTQRAEAAPSRVSASHVTTLVQPGDVLVSSHNGVYLSTRDGDSRLIYSARAYDTLQLPSGDMFVSERYRNRVVRLNAEGQTLYELEAQGPVDCELAADGTLVVVQNGSGEVVGMDAESGEVRWRLGGFSNHYDVSLTPGGEMLVADSGNGRVLRYDAERTLVAEYGGLGFPNTVEALSNGNTLVTTYHDKGILELDRAGNVVNEFEIGGTVFRAQRLLDGRTLVFEGERGDGQSLLHVFAADGTPLGVRSAPRGTDFELAR